MPRISKIRIVGNRYDKFKKHHENSIFDLTRDGEPDHTLFTLKNGNGKGVMMQLISQIVLPETRWGKNNGSRVTTMFYNQYRNFIPYTFHVILEWKLDTVPERWLIAGVCMTANIRHSGDEEQEEKIGLQYFLYTMEHNNNGKYTVENLPAYNNLEKRVTPYDSYEDFINNNKQYFRKYSKTAASRTNSDYYQYLESNGIYRAEWQILKLINKSEGGLGEYFSQTGDNKDLFDNMIIPAITENMYNQNEEYRDALKDIFRSNITITRKLPVLLAREDDFNNLITMLEPLIEDAEIGIRYRERMERCITDGNNLYHGFNNYYNFLQSELKKSRQEEEKALKEQEDLAFEEDNLEYARLNRELQGLMAEKQELKKEADNYRQQLEELKEEKKRYQINKLIVPLEQAVASHQTKTRLKKEITDSIEITNLKEEMDRVTNSIKKEWKKTARDWGNIQEKHQAFINYLNGERDDCKKKRKNLEEKIQRIEVEVKTYQNKVKDIEKKEKELGQVFNPLQLQVPQVLLEELKEEYTRREQKLEHLVEEINILTEELEKLKEKKLENEYDTKKLQEKYNGLEDVFNKRKDEEEKLSDRIISVLNLERFQEVYRKQWLKEKQLEIDNLIDEKEEKMNEIKKDLWENNIDLSLNEDRDYWVANNDLLTLQNKITEMGVKVQPGSQFIMSLKEEEKKEVLKNFPSLPYGLIILQEKDWELIENNIKNDFLLHAAVPVFIRSSMTGVPARTSFRIVEDNSREFLLNHDLYLNWKDKLTDRSERIKEAIASIRNSIAKLRDIFVTGTELLKKESSADIKVQLDELDLKIKKYISQGKELNTKIQKTRERYNTLQNREVELQDRNKETEEEIKIIKDFIQQKEELAEEEKGINIARKSLTEYRQKHDEIGVKLGEINTRYNEEEVNYRTWIRKLEEKLPAIREVVSGASLEFSGHDSKLIDSEIAEDQAKIGELKRDVAPRYPEVGSEEIFMKLEKRQSLNSKLEEKNSRLAVINSEIKGLEERIEEYQGELRQIDIKWKDYQLSGVSAEMINQRLQNTEQQLVVTSDNLSRVTSRMDKLSGKIESINDTIQKTFKEIKKQYNRAALLWDELNLAEKEIKLQKAIKENNEYLETISKIINGLQDKIIDLKGIIVQIKHYKELDLAKGESNELLMARVKDNAGQELEKWVNRYDDISNELSKHRKECEINFDQFKQNLKNTVQDKTLKGKIKETISDGINIDNFSNNLDSFVSMREHFKREINSLSQDKQKAEEAREQWANRASMQVLKIIESLREMIGKMVYNNENGYAFPLVRLQGSEHLPHDEEDVKYLLKEYFLECIEKINKSDLDINELSDRDLDKYMGDQAIFARALRGRYPLVEVYKMTEKNEFLYARPRDYNYSSWEAIKKGNVYDAEGSGGQTLSINSFIIMMLMNYRKKTVANENPWTVLLLDNPFGSASAEHILDPVFKIADKLNFQLITFASPEIIKTEISERFPVFWALQIAGQDEGVEEGTVTGRVIHGGRIRKSEPV